MATDNELLASIQATLEEILTSELRAYSDLEGGDTPHSIDDGDATPFERDEDTNARGVVVVNIGANPAYVYENENLIGIVAAGESWVSPTAGQGEFSVTTEPDSDLTSTIHFTTLRK